MSSFPAGNECLKWMADGSSCHGCMQLNGNIVMVTFSQLVPSDTVAVRPSEASHLFSDSPGLVLHLESWLVSEWPRGHFHIFIVNINRLDDFSANGYGSVF